MSFLIPELRSSLKISPLENPPQDCKFSLILPTYQEGDNIEKLVVIITTILDNIIPNQYELIVVDDDSPDLTWKIAQDLIRQYPQLRVMRRTEER